MKNIVLCCDGTSNEFSKNNTNVVKLYQLLAKDPATQVAYYHPGLGTMEAVGAITSFGRKITKLLGLAIGYGLEDDIKAAALFLMRTYQPGDRIFMFGFSRGAYTVRAVASLLHMYGLIEGNNDALVPYAIRMLSAISKEGEHDRAHDAFDLAKGFQQTFSGRPCPIHFVGVWDTVNSVGWISNPLKLPYTANNPSIEIGRHAISLDERRAFFRQNRWIPKPPNVGPKDLKQVWFPGDHCDVGGGHVEAESAQSRIALAWMLQEAMNAGLSVDAAAAAATLADGVTLSQQANQLHDILGKLHWWWIAEYVPKQRYDYTTHKTSWRINAGSRRTIPPASFVHASAYARGNDYIKRLPPDATPTT
jgi:uncharacterized protein (DUF2235 family)